MGLAIAILVLAGLYIFIKSRANNASSPIPAVSAPVAAPPVDATPAATPPAPAAATPAPKAGKTKATVAPAPSQTVSAAPGKLIYPGTGKVIPGSAIYDDAHQCESLQSGGCRASTRWLCWGGKGGCGCVPYFNLETTMYATYGPKAPNTKGTARSIISVGGSGQSDANCCIYSIGFEVATGKAYAEEEGPHSPKAKIGQMSGTLPVTIGPLYNRTIGLKSILIHEGGQPHLIGFVDQKADGNWVKFYDAVSPSGGGNPVITKIGMGGSVQPTCQEMRFRTDNVWPVNIDKTRSFIAELTGTGSPTGGTTSTPKTPSSKAKVPKIGGTNTGSGGTVPIGKAGMAMEEPRYRGHRYVIDDYNNDALVDLDEPSPYTSETQEEYWPECDSTRQKNYYGYSMFGSLDKRYAGYI